jgi:hypothetical protein
MSASPKVSASTVGAAFTTLIIGIIGPHLFPHGMAPDVQGLVSAGVTAAVTFGAGWLARDAVKFEADATKVADSARSAATAFTKIEQASPQVAEVAKALEAEAAHVVLPVAQAVAK